MSNSGDTLRHQYQETELASTGLGKSPPESWHLDKSTIAKLQPIMAQNQDAKGDQTNTQPDSPTSTASTVSQPQSEKSDYSKNLPPVDDIKLSCPTLQDRKDASKLWGISITPDSPFADKSAYERDERFTKGEIALYSFIRALKSKFGSKNTTNIVFGNGSLLNITTSAMRETGAEQLAQQYDDAAKYISEIAKTELIKSTLPQNWKILAWDDLVADCKNNNTDPAIFANQEAEKNDVFNEAIKKTAKKYQERHPQIRLDSVEKYVLIETAYLMAYMEKQKIGVLLYYSTDKNEPEAFAQGKVALINDAASRPIYTSMNPKAPKLLKENNIHNTHKESFSSDNSQEQESAMPQPNIQKETYTEEKKLDQFYKKPAPKDTGDLAGAILSSMCLRLDENEITERKLQYVAFLAKELSKTPSHTSTERNKSWPLSSKQAEEMRNNMDRESTAEPKTTSPEKPSSAKSSPTKKNPQSKLDNNNIKFFAPNKLFGESKDQTPQKDESKTPTPLQNNIQPEESKNTTNSM